jgi:hypothetical protein
MASEDIKRRRTENPMDKREKEVIRGHKEKVRQPNGQLWSIGLSFLLFMTSDDPFFFCPFGCLSFFSLWPLIMDKRERGHQRS